MIVGARDNGAHGPVIVGIDEVETDCERKRVRRRDTKVVPIVSLAQLLTICVSASLLDRIATVHVIQRVTDSLNWLRGCFRMDGKIVFHVKHSSPILLLCVSRLDSAYDMALLGSAIAVGVIQSQYW